MAVVFRPVPPGARQATLITGNYLIHAQCSGKQAHSEGGVQDRIFSFEFCVGAESLPTKLKTQNSKLKTQNAKRKTKDHHPAQVPATGDSKDGGRRRYAGKPLDIASRRTPRPQDPV
jgi:hypothetical protein